MENNNPFQVAIIGSGPAGMAAAIQLQRYGINFVLFEAETKNSLLLNAHKVENYLGFPKGISGTELLGIFEQQLLSQGVKAKPEKIIAADYLEKNQLFQLSTSKSEYFASCLIIATGTKPKKVTAFDSLNQAEKNKIGYDVYPLLTSKNKKIAIIGAGDTAFDYALNLLENNNEVTIFNRGTEIKALPCLRDEVFNHKNFHYFPSATSQRLLSQLNNYDNLLLAIGREPAKDFYTNNLREVEKKLVQSKKLYLAGDVKNDIYRQTAIAVGDGVKAAMKIIKGN